MTIREFFSTRRPIDRPIEKVIDYYATDEKRLAAEIEEYEVTEGLERCFSRFLEAYDSGVRGGQATEIGIWVAGFYGSGKSSFTKYLGFALDGDTQVSGRLFLDLLAERIPSATLRAHLKTLAQKEPTAVVMLDLGAEQLAESAAEPVSKVVYYKVLQWAGYSKEKKLAQMELLLEERGLLEDFNKAYREQWGEEWAVRHNDPLAGIARAAKLVPRFLKEFETEDSFRRLQFDEAIDIRELAQRILRIIRKKSGKQNVLFLIDEAGQYVAPRGELILNLDGLARNFKELGQGHVWVACTGQQTLKEIVERSALNSPELNKLRDRFPIEITLEATDIREITYRRLLAKSPEGEKALKDLFSRHGQALLTHTRLKGTKLYGGDYDAVAFARFYPFLPQHFDLLLELIRNLARSTGGIGLRSAIRVIQDLLVDASRLLLPGVSKLADRPQGTLACVDDFYNTLRADIGRVLPHAVHGVERVMRAFADDPMAQRLVKGIAVLQCIEGFPCTEENLAALLFPSLGGGSLLEAVKETLRRLQAQPECGVINDPETGGYQFLSDQVRQIREEERRIIPKAQDIALLRSEVLKALFDPAPSARVQDVKEVKGGIRWGKASIAEPDAEVQFVLEHADLAAFSDRRTALLSETAAQSEYRNRIAWLITLPTEVEDLLMEVCRATKLRETHAGREADRDVSKYLRGKKKQEDACLERCRKLINQALLDGLFIYRGRPTPALEAGETLASSTRSVLKKVAEDLFPHLRLVPIRPSTDLASRFLGVERLDRVATEQDPLKLIVTQGGRPRINLGHPALAETLRAFGEKVEQSGTGRLQGNFIQDFFAASPYGWSKDATRYLFAALLRAGEIRVHTGEGTLQTASPKAQEAFKSALIFNRLGLSRRDDRISTEALDRAATALEALFGVEVLPLEERIAETVRREVPRLMGTLAPLPDRIRLLRLPGEERARTLLAALGNLLGQDGAAAPALLAEPSGTTCADAKWAESVVKSLDESEQEIRGAKDLVADLDRLFALFTQERMALGCDEAAAAIREALAGENFHERLADLRTETGNILRLMAARYQSQRQALEAELLAARDRLEALPAWIRLSPEDREDSGARFAVLAVPGALTQGKEVDGLQLLCTRLGQVPALEQELSREVRKRLPEEQPPGPTPTPPPEGAEEIEEISFAGLAPAELLRSTNDLEVWIRDLRNRLTEILHRGKTVKIKGQ